MKIAQVTPLYEAVPPKLYGGTERVVANLARGMTELGHEVTLFASGDSRTAARLVPGAPVALRLAESNHQSDVAFHMAQLAAVAARLDEFDVIHNHADVFGLPLSLLDGPLVVTTLHGRLDEAATQAALRAYQDTAYVSISDHQRLPVADLPWAATVYHGLPIENFRFSAEPGTYLAFLGRTSREKRLDLAIDIAHLAGVPLKIAAKVDPVDRAYYEAEIKPRIDGRFIEYVGEIGEHEKSDFLGGAVAMLFPIDWPEPFGIAPVEAWATGTPVLARPYGSVPELHADGITGYVRDDVAELAALVGTLSRFDRARCRAYAERNFSLHRMCEDYLDVYRHQGRRQAARHGRPDHAGEGAETLQPGQPDGGRWGVLHPFRRAAAGHQQDRIERQ